MPRHEFHVALDGNGLNGLEGRAGVCAFRHDPASGESAVDIRYFDGLAGAHAVSLSPDGRTGYLGTTDQHLTFYDTDTLEERHRISTLSLEGTDSTIKGSTHAVWLDATTVVVSIGENLWLADIDRLSDAKPIGAHGLKIPHGMKRSASGRYLVYGGMDHPVLGEAREVGIFDLELGSARRVELPTTCWHVTADPDHDRFYALSFRVVPQRGYDYHEWAIGRFKEYVYEIDAVTGDVLRHWCAGQDAPVHINSDVCLSDTELIYCNGASGTIVLIDRASFSSYRMLDLRPSAGARAGAWRQQLRTISDTIARGSALTESHQYWNALRATRGVLFDSVYACQLTTDQTYLFTANRGLNQIVVYSYPDLVPVKEVAVPPLQSFDRSLPWWADPRLGFHHGCLATVA